MSTMTTSETVGPHKHQCAKCGEEFEATCGHLIYRERERGGWLYRPAKPHEYPYIVAACPKPECTWNGL